MVGCQSLVTQCYKAIAHSCTCMLGCQSLVTLYYKAIVHSCTCMVGCQSLVTQCCNAIVQMMYVRMPVFSVIGDTVCCKANTHITYGRKAIHIMFGIGCQSLVTQCYKAIIHSCTCMVGCQSLVTQCYKAIAHSCTCMLGCQSLVTLCYKAIVHSCTCMLGCQSLVTQCYKAIVQMMYVRMPVFSVIGDTMLQSHHTHHVW